MEELNRQLDWHQSNEKTFPALTEQVPLKSRMSNKAERVRELKKAVDRYKNMILTPQPVENVSGDIEMVDSRQDDSFYASGYEDNMV